MIRVLLLYLFLLLLPTLLYFLYVYTLRWLRGTTAPVDPAPVLWLFFAGALLTICAIAYVIEFTRQGATSYTPPVFRDGVVVPGEEK
jgi:hypothetical protein